MFLKTKGLSIGRRGFGLSRTRPTRLGGCVWRIGALRGRQAWFLGLRKSGGGGEVCSGEIGVSSCKDVCSFWPLGI